MYDVTESFKYSISINAINMSPHLTFSIPPPVFLKMKSHPEIRWGTLAREAIFHKVQQLEGTVSSPELRKLLEPNVVEQLRQISDPQYQKHLRELKRKEWKRMNS